MTKENENKNAFISRAHFEAIKQIPDAEERVAIYEAIFTYQFYGAKPENLPPIAKALMTAIMPELEQQREMQLMPVFEKGEQSPAIVAPLTSARPPWRPPYEVTCKS